MSNLEDYNNARSWWERKKSELEKNIDELIETNKEKNEVVYTLMTMKDLLNNNVIIKKKQEEETIN